MARFTTQTTSVVNFEANIEQLENFYNTLEKRSSQVSMSDNLRKDFKTLEVEIEQLNKQAKSIKPEDMTPDLVAEYVKRYQEIYRKGRQLNKKLLEEATNSTNTQLDILSSRIETLTSDIVTNEKELNNLRNKFPEDDPVNKTVGFASQASETKFLKGFAESEGLLEKMKGSSGQLISNFRTMYENAELLTESFLSVGDIQKKLNDGLKQGLSLEEIKKSFSKDEIKDLQTVLSEKNKNFNIDTALEQIQIRHNLETKQANFLYEQQNRINQLSSDIAADKLKLNEKQLKKDEELLKLQNQSSSAQKEQIDLYEELDKLILQGSTTGTVSLKELREATLRLTKSQRELNKETKKQDGTFVKATKQVFNYGIAFSALRRIYRETLQTVRDLDKALTEMATVTSMTREETWELVGTMQQLAAETGFTTTEIAKLSTIYFRQGRTLREVIQLTRVAAQAARIAGISAAQSADFLTSAVNAFQISADQALAVSDKFASLAASSASSYEELAVGLSKFAAQANIAGISIDFAMGLLAKGIETTREAPETIGTALKTVIARMRELTDLGKTFEDGMDISRVETALRQVGVQLRNDQGQFRELELVLSELGQRWDTLNTNQQASVAVALAGTRQQSRLIAIMQNFDRTLELVDIAQESAGATMAQHTQFMRGMEAATVGLQTAYQKFITTITDSDFIIGVVRALGAVINGVAVAFEKLGFAGQTSMFVLTSLFVVMRFGKTIMTAFTKLLGIQTILQGKQAFFDDLRAKKLKIQAVIQAINNALINITNILLKKQNVLLPINTAQTIANTKAKAGNAAATKGQLASSINLKSSFIGMKGVISKTLIPALKFLSKLLLKTPIGWVVLGIGILIKGFRDLSKGTTSFAGSFARSIKSLMAVVINFFKLIGDLLKVIFGLNGAFKRTDGRVSRLQRVFQILSIALNAITVLFNVLNIAVGYVRTGLNFVVEKITEFISKIPFIERILNIFAHIGNVIDNISEGLEEGVERTERFGRVLNSTYEELLENLKEIRKENQAENFELLQKNRTLNDLISKYEDLQETRRRGIFGPEEAEAEAELLRELEDIDQDLVVRDGIDINLGETFNLIEADIEENARVISENLREIAERALELSQRDFERFMSGSDGALTDVQNFLIHIVDEDLTREQVTALRNYYTALFRELGRFRLTDLNSMVESPNNLNMVRIINEAVSEFSSVVDEYSNDFDELASKYQFFVNQLNNLSSSASTAFQETFSELGSVIDLFKDQGFSLVLNEIGFAPDILNQFSNALDKSNISLGSFLHMITDMSSNIRELTPEIDGPRSVRQAIILLASTMDDATTSAFLYSRAMGRSLLEATQAADLLTSRIKNLSESQEEFLSGNLSDQDLFELVESYSSLFANEDFVDAFSNGLSLSNFLIRDAINLAEEYEDQLLLVTAQLQNATGEERVGLLASQQRLLLLIQYQGAFKGLTTQQIKYNNTLKAFNLLTRLGIDATSIQIRKVKELGETVGPSLKIISDNLEKTDNAINSILLEDGIGLSAEDIYTVVDGVVILSEAFHALRPAIKEAIEDQIEFVESGLEGIYSIFETLMNETLALEEKMANDRIKVYEDYFAALDRLELQRERKVERQDLVKQLSRLESATDERSRARALELRKELNSLDQKTAEETIEQSRESLFDSITASVEKIRETFHQVFQDFVTSGARSGEALFSRLVSAGLIDSSGSWNDIEVNFAAPQIQIPTLPQVSFSEAALNALDTRIANLFSQIDDPSTTTEEEVVIREEIALALQQRNALVTIQNRLNTGIRVTNLREVGTFTTIPPSTGSGGGGGSSDTAVAQADAFPQNAKGGMVDYTGLSMLHGTKTRPEAVLSPSQTQMFIGLRDALENAQFSSSSGGNINIDNISISTGSMNNNQDFKRAGETLADAFKNAIQRKGITINTNKV